MGRNDARRGGGDTSASSREDRVVEMKVERFLREDGIGVQKPSKLSEGRAWEMAFQMRPGAPVIVAIRTKGIAKTVFTIQVKTMPEHARLIQEMTSEKRQEVLKRMRRTALQGAGVVGFGMEVEPSGNLVGWVMDVVVYDDGMSSHTMHTLLRMLMIKHLEVMDVFSEVVGVAMPMNNDSTESKNGQAQPMPGYS